jgi:hypothetical protein
VAYFKDPLLFKFCICKEEYVSARIPSICLVKLEVKTEKVYRHKEVNKKLKNLTKSGKIGSNE